MTRASLTALIVGLTLNGLEPVPLICPFVYLGPFHASVVYKRLTCLLCSNSNCLEWPDGPIRSFARQLLRIDNYASRSIVKVARKLSLFRIESTKYERKLFQRRFFIHCCDSCQPSVRRAFVSLTKALARERFTFHWDYL